MATGSNLLALAENHVGERYEHGVVPKDAPDYAGPWDCAEFASWLVYQTAGQLYGCQDNAAKPGKADAYTGAWRRDAQRIGRMVPVETAAAIPGAFLLRYPPGSGEMGHVAVSDGKGGTVEAMGRAYGVRRGKVSGRRWNTGVLPPGIAYDPAAAPISVTAPAAIYALDVPNMATVVIERIQDALQARGVALSSPRGVFDPAMAEAVTAFQNAAGVVADGEVGPQTAEALGISLNPAGALAGAAGAALRVGSTLLSPLVSLAAVFVPAVLRAIAGDNAATMVEKISTLVIEIAGTEDPGKARSALENNPAARQQLELRLAELLVQQERQREQAQLEAARVRSESERAERDDQLKALETQLADVRNARGIATVWASQGSLMGWGPLLVSATVLGGFLLILGAFVALMILKVELETDTGLFQLFNVSFGALTAAFATVVSFWLGSSQGSRAKDAASIARDAEQTSRRAEPSATASHAPAAGSARPADAPAKADAATGSPSNFDRCLTVVFGREGGFSNDKDDNGGPTQFGITLQTFRDWRASEGDTTEPSLEDLKKLTRAEARSIYYNRYWNRLRCDELPRGIDLMVFDFGVNAGPGRAARMLQEIVGANPDGAVGKITLACLRMKPVRFVIDEMAKRRLVHYRGLNDWTVFSDGWSNRTEIIAAAARDMAADELRLAA